MKKLFILFVLLSVLTSCKLRTILDEGDYIHAYQSLESATSFTLEYYLEAEDDNLVLYATIYYENGNYHIIYTDEVTDYAYYEAYYEYIDNVATGYIKLTPSATFQTSSFTYVFDRDEFVETFNTNDYTIIDGEYIELEMDTLTIDIYIDTYGRFNTINYFQELENGSIDKTIVKVVDYNETVVEFPTE